MEESLMYKGTEIFIRHKSCSLVHTAGTEESLPIGVELSEVETKAREFGVEVIGNEDEYGLGVKAKTKEEAETAVKKIKKFLDYSKEKWNINWW